MRDRAPRRGRRSPLLRVAITLAFTLAFAIGLALFSPEAPAVKERRALTLTSSLTASSTTASTAATTAAVTQTAADTIAATTGFTAAQTLQASANNQLASANVAATTASLSMVQADASAAQSLQAQAGNQLATVNTATLAATQSTGGTAVRVGFFSATRTRRIVVLRWRTASEVDTLGFNLYRGQGPKRVRVNGRLIPARGGSTGRAYSYTHRLPPRLAATLRYWLQIVHSDGSRSWYGPVAARR